MHKTTNKTYAISLGGSLIVPPGGIDWKFLKKFRALILAEVKGGKKFFIITGGGATCRAYNAAAGKAADVEPESLDRLGIQATRLNACLMQTIFGRMAHFKIIENPILPLATNKKVVIAGGWKPGCSTDYGAVLIARAQKIKILINLSNIDYAYTRDPKKYQDARKIEKISWPEFRKIVGSKWTPGLNTPFDPVASRLAQQLGLKVVIMNGEKLKNLQNLLAGQKFKGTVIG